MSHVYSRTKIPVFLIFRVGGDIICSSWVECFLDISHLPEDGLNGLLWKFYWLSGITQ